MRARGFAFSGHCVGCGKQGENRRGVCFSVEPGEEAVMGTWLCLGCARRLSDKLGVAMAQARALKRRSAPGPCPVCSGPRRLAADSLASAGSVKALRILYCPTCAGEGRSVAPVAEMAVTAGASS